MLVTKIDIWENLEYVGALDDGFKPMMTTYIRSGEKKRGLVLIFPGGGYTGTSPREAEPIALRFTDAGYHAVFLDYSVSPRRHPQPLMDAARALSIIKENADEWCVDMDNIFVCGFSAGGHLCASLSNLYREDWLAKVSGIDVKDIKLKGSILCYPVIAYGEYMHKGSFDNLIGENAEEKAYLEMSMERCVHKATPPTFLWHTVEDGAVPVENTLLYVKALRENERPFEVHIYPDGGHGLSLATEEVATSKEGIIPHVAGWTKQCIQWMSSLD